MSNITTREAYGLEIVKIAEQNKDIVVLDADISKSTRTLHFSKKFPDRFINVGIAEQNLIGIAAGLATCGKIPVCSTYATFASMRACEQVRTSVCYANLNVKIAASHGGLTACTDGVTHQGIEDLGIMRGMPNMNVLVPADANAARALTHIAVRNKGPFYLRLMRDLVPPIYDEGEKFELGRGKRLREGKDVTIIAIGDMVYQSLEAATELSSKGIDAEVIDAVCLKPLDTQLISNSVTKTRCVVTVEDHNVINGLGSAVCEFCSGTIPVPVQRLGLQDTFAESAKYSDLLEKYKFGVPYIVSTAVRLVENK